MKEMTCREFDEIVHTFVRMELLDVNVREAALEHATQCELCSERMADAAVLAEVSELMGQSSREMDAPDRVEASVLAAFRDYHRRAAWRRTAEWIGVGAAAAVFLVFLWTVGGHSKVQPSAAPKKDVSSQSGMPLEAKSQGMSQQSEGMTDAVIADVPATACPIHRFN
jgi:hypothetical protein